MEETLKTIEYALSNPSDKSPYYYRLSETDLKDMDITQAEGDTFIVNYATEVTIENDLEISTTPTRTNSYAQSQEIMININSDNLSELKYKWTTILNRCTKYTVKIESVQDNGVGTIKEYAYYLGENVSGYNSTWKHTGTNSNIIEMKSGDPGATSTTSAYIVAIDSLGNVGPMYKVKISVGEPLK